MSFLASFVEGFATQASKDIEERDKELRNDAKIAWDSLLKEREKAKLRAEKRGEELDEKARQLRAFGLNDQQIVAIYTSGLADETLKKLSEMEVKLTPERSARLVTIQPGQEVPSFEALKTSITELKPGTATPSATQSRTLFGLPSTAYEQQEKELAARYGVSPSEVRKTKLGEMPSVAAKIDLTSLMSEKQAGMAKSIDLQELELSRLRRTVGENHPDYIAAKNELDADKKIHSKSFEKPPSEKEIYEQRYYGYFNQAANTTDPVERDRLFAKGKDLQERVRLLERKSDTDNKITPTSFSTLVSRAFHAGASEGASKIGSANFRDVPNMQGGVDRVFTPTNPQAQAYGTALGHKQVQMQIEVYKDPKTGAYPKDLVVALATIPGVTIVNGQPVFKNLEEATAAAQVSAKPAAAPGLGARSQPKPATQAPATAEAKQMPTGTKLTEYANAHFGGDVTKAKDYLRSQGYKE